MEAWVEAENKVPWLLLTYSKPLLSSFGQAAASGTLVKAEKTQKSEAKGLSNKLTRPDMYDIMHCGAAYYFRGLLDVVGILPQNARVLPFYPALEKTWEEQTRTLTAIF